ncbi:MAG: PEP/pyruvate-binding domain-containing protein, partial [Pseudomonadota bacterium]
MSKWVYGFGAGQADGDASMKALLGGKGANLAEMCGLGLAVPPGLTITTDVCTHYYAHEKTYPAELEAEVKQALAAIEETAGAKLGDPEKPLLLSAPRSAPRA